MKEITIDCSFVTSARELHQLLADKLQFPQWYGHNLDALHDMLTAMTEPVHLTLTGCGTLPAALLRGFRRVLEDCQQENPNLHIDIT